MQNLALWHASLAFPSLPRTPEYQRLALARMDDQMKFYVSRRRGRLRAFRWLSSCIGLKLLGFAFRYIDLMHRNAAAGVDRANTSSAKRVYATAPPPRWFAPYVRRHRRSKRIQLGSSNYSYQLPDHHAGPLAYESQWRPAKADRCVPGRRVIQSCGIGLEAWSRLSTVEPDGCYLVQFRRSRPQTCR